MLPDEVVQKLIAKSRNAMKEAHCPYSNFPVGAALLSSDGTIFTGCNVENAAYTVGLCAERTAVVKAVSEGHKSFKAIAIASNIDSEFIGPCGACRQFLVEFGVNLDVIMTKSGGEVKTVPLKELLPFTFTASSLSAAE